MIEYGNKTSYWWHMCGLILGSQKISKLILLLKILPLTLSAVGIATGFGPGIKNFLHVVQTGSGVHPASYTVGTGGYIPGGKAAGS
jgi:hypothetical protein